MTYGLKAVSRIAAKSYENSKGCWVFKGARNSNGYGVIGMLEDNRKVTRYTHRVAYEVLVAPVPEGLQLDHLCRNRSCWNPSHLDPVTHKENGMRGASPQVRAHIAGVCMRGHQQTQGNVYETKSGRRQCAVCARASAKRRRHGESIRPGATV